MTLIKNNHWKTLKRVVVPISERTAPLFLKWLYGAIGIILVVSLFIVYSDKRYVEGWTHSESISYMLMKLGMFLVYLIPIGIGCVVLWWLFQLVINFHFETRKRQPESQPAIQPTVTPKESKQLAPIDEERLKPYFKASFKGMGQNINHFPDLIRELEHIRKGSATDVGRAAYMIYNSSHMTKKPQTFARWMRAFFDILGVPVPKDMSQNKYEPTKEIKDRLYFLQ